MIILDTNQLLANRSLDTPALTLVQTIAHMTEQRLAIPDLVAEEFAARRNHTLEERQEKVIAAAKEVRALIPGWVFTPPGPTGLWVVEVWNKLRGLFEILPVSANNAREALFREAHRRRPASTSWESDGGRGARDACIWLDALDGRV
jgi:predicted nucleic acid-binding protein